MPRKGRDNYRTWMPLYVGEYLTDTMHFSRADHGSYLLLLMYYWANKGLPNDENTIRKIAKCDNREWPALRSKLSQKFEITHDLAADCQTWTHFRVDAELAQAFENKQRADHTSPNLTLSKKVPKGETHFLNGRSNSGKLSCVEAGKQLLAKIRAEIRDLEAEEAQGNGDASRH